VFIDGMALNAQRHFVAKFLYDYTLNHMNEEMGSLYSLYAHKIGEVNPLISPVANDWGSKWNLVTPPDTFPYNPHIVFQGIDVVREA
jgi:hypothetical protein